jgi:hypothetical protein
MLDQQVVDYIKKARNSSMSDQQIKDALMQNGWTQQEIEENFAAVNGVNVDVQREQQPAQDFAGLEPQTQPEAKQPEIKQPDFYTSPRDKKPKRLVKMLFSLAAIILIIGLGAAAFYFLEPLEYIYKLVNIQNSPSSDALTQNQESVTATATPIKASFAKYNLETTKFTPALPNYTIKIEELANLANFEKSQNISFSQEQKDSLIKNNFFVQANYDKFYNSNPNDATNRNDDWTYLYGKIVGSYATWQREPENSIFITTDFLTHVYHKLVEQEFSYIEQANFYPTLSELSKSMLSSVSNGFLQTEDSLQKESYERLSVYFLVASSILDTAATDYDSFKTQNFANDTKTDTKAAALALAESLAKENNISETAKKIAQEEIGLIFDAKNITESPLMGKYSIEMQEDYTQFAPRSYYTKNTILRNYFRAMMWYGRINFLLKSPELTRDAANISLLLAGVNQKNWESIYLPTSFFVEQSDDLSIYEYNQAIKKINFTGTNQSDQEIVKLQTELLGYKNPQIMSSVIISSDVLNTTKEDLQNTTKGFRFMGQRFTPDAFVFSTLTQGQEKPDDKTGQSLPSTPTALMLTTLLGSKTSNDLLNTWISKNAPDSDKVIADRMATLQSYFDKTSQEQWTSNIYWSWLYTIKSLFNNVNIAGYPVFMKSEEWAKKNLQSFLGSWTELKHDTLLYAKQSYAELGGGGEEEGEAKPVPKGYVEPNIEFFDRLIALVNLTNDGLKQFNLLPPNLQSRNSSFVENLQFYRTIAVAQLQNQIISDEDFEKLRLSAGQLDNMLQVPDSGIKLESNARSALIADVHTDAVKGQILYEANGIPNYIYVAVKDANGTRLTKGLVYSYYEFTDSISKRLNDQAWQGFNYSDSIKKLIMPEWNKSLIK